MAVLRNVWKVGWGGISPCWSVFPGDRGSTERDGGEGRVIKGREIQLLCGLCFGAISDKWVPPSLQWQFRLMSGSFSPSPIALSCGGHGDAALPWGTGKQHCPLNAGFAIAAKEGARISYAAYLLSGITDEWWLSWAAAASGWSPAPRGKDARREKYPGKPLARGIAGAGGSSALCAGRVVPEHQLHIMEGKG